MHAYVLVFGQDRGYKVTALFLKMSFQILILIHHGIAKLELLELIPVYMYVHLQVSLSCSS